MLHFLFSDVGIVEITKYANSLSVVAVLALIIVGGFKRWWVFGWHYTQVEREKNDWRELALKGTSLAEELTEAHRQRRIFEDGKDT